ncbi:MAG: flagellar brake protein [Pseudomonadales bacterium]|nr:flagellar brake protein [Pseudomonadales bacterium]
MQDESAKATPEQNKRQAAPLSFAKLGLEVGAALTMETVSPARKFTIRMIGYVPDRSILISAPTREGKEVLLEKGDKVTLRAMSRNRVFAAETRVLYRTLQPYTYYHLAFPSELTAHEIRKASRVRVDLPVMIDSEFDLGLGEWPKSAIIEDLSKDGAGLLTRQILGEAGHEVIVNLSVSVSEIHRDLEIPCIIRNREVVQRASGSQYFYGVQFDALSDEDRLTLNSFLYEMEQAG